MSHMNPTIHFNRPDRKTWLMVMLGGCLLVLGISRGLIRTAARIPSGSETARSASGLESGFLPMIEASHLPSLSAEVAQLSGVSNTQFINLEAIVQEAETVVSLPDGRIVPVDQVPLRLVIPSLGVNAPVVTASLGTTQFDGGLVYQWLAPDFTAAGWHYSSALLGEAGNTVINGHHNAYGEVFRDLVKLEVGDLIFIESDNGYFSYVVEEILIFREKYVSAEVRRQNARLIEPTADERLTLVTCWPYESNSNRLLIIARPFTDTNPSGLQDSP